MAVSHQGLVAVPGAHLPPKLQPGRSETDETMMRTRGLTISSNPALFPSRDAQRQRSDEILQEAVIRVDMQHTALDLQRLWGDARSGQWSR
jgi:hypothetical protein